MNDVQILHRDAMSGFWRERWPTATAAIVVVLLAAGLLALIWMAVHGPEPTRRTPTPIQLLLVHPMPPPRQPPKPATETMQRVQAPPPVPVPPKKLVQDRRDSIVASQAPKPKPAQPQPKTRLPATADPLSLDAPPDWRQASLPQGANAGTMIGGNGDNGSGAGCGGADLYLTLVTSQLRAVFERDEKNDRSSFRIQAQLWFDDTGGVQRSQLVGSTGNAELDVTVGKLLKAVNIGAAIPKCLQPITAWVNRPWRGMIRGADDRPVITDHVETWPTRGRP
jgi:periplasmic protein TonB